MTGSSSGGVLGAEGGVNRMKGTVPPGVAVTVVVLVVALVDVAVAVIVLVDAVAVTVTVLLRDPTERSWRTRSLPESTTKSVSGTAASM